MPSFLFECGNSDEGPIGFCARVTADTREAALEILRKALPSGTDGTDIEHYGDADEIEYLTVYFNPQHVLLENSDPDEDEDDEDDEDDDGEALDLSAEWRENDLKTMLREEQKDEDPK